MIKLIGKKRFVSFLLSLLLLISLVPSTAFTAFAAEGTLEGVCEGLEFSWDSTNGDVKFEDSKITMTVAKEENSCGSTTSLYVKNPADKTVILSFSYDVPKASDENDDSAGYLVYDDNYTKVRGKNSDTVKIEAGATKNFKLYRGSAESFTATLSNFKNEGFEQKIYFQYPTDGTWGDHNNVKVNSLNKTSKVYCNVYALYGNKKTFYELDYNSKDCSCICEDKEKGLYSYEFSKEITVNSEKKKRLIEDDADYIVVFSTTANGEYQTAPLNMGSECLGDTVVLSDPVATRENAENSAISDYLSQWKNNDKYKTAADISSTAKYLDGQLPLHMPAEKLLSDKLITNLVNPVTNGFFKSQETTAALCEKLGVKPAGVFAQYASDYSQHIEDEVSPASEVPVDYITYKNESGESVIIPAPEAVKTALGIAGEDVYTLAGTSDFIDIGWGPSPYKYIMTEGEDGLYSITVPNVKKSEAIYACKVVKFIEGDGSNAYWYGMDGTDLNYDFSVTEDCDVTVTFNPETKEINVTGKGVSEPNFDIKYIIATGDGKNGFLNDHTYDPTAEDNKMTEISEGVYEITYQDVKANEKYKVKFAANGNWDINWGAAKDAVFENGKTTDAYYNSDQIIFTPVSESDKVDITLRLDISNWDKKHKTGATYTITAEEFKPALKVKVTSNLFPTVKQTYTDFSGDENGDTFVTVDYKLKAENKYLVNLDVKYLTWDNKVLEFKEAYNKYGTGHKARTSIFPFAYEQGTGYGMVNTFDDGNTGRVAASYSSVNPAAYAYNEDGSAITLVRAVFKVLDIRAKETTVDCNFNVVSLDDDDTPAEKITSHYKLVDEGKVSEEYSEMSEITTEVQTNAESFKPDPAEITLDPCGGTVEPDYVIADENGVIKESDIPAPTREGYAFTGWFADKTDETPLPEKFTEDATIYAHWRELTFITFDPDGGSVEPAKLALNSKGRLDSLPTATKDGWEFKGWYMIDSELGEITVDKTTTFLTAETVYARWEKPEPPTEKETAKVTEPTEKETDKVTEPTEKETEKATSPTEPETVKATDPTEQETEKETAKATDPTEKETEKATEAPTEPAEATQKVYYMPDKGLVEDGDTVTIIVEDEKGNATINEMTKTSDSYDGAAVYSYDIPVSLIPAYVQLRVQNGENLKNELTLNKEQFAALRGKIIKTDGTAYSDSEEPTQAASKKPNPVKVKAKTKTIKAKKLKSKKQTAKPLKITKAKGKISVVKMKKGTTAKIFKKITVKKSTGAITFKKGKYAKKTYKIKLKITVKGTKTYKSKTIKRTVKIKIR